MDNCYCSSTMPICNRHEKYVDEANADAEWTASDVEELHPWLRDRRGGREETEAPHQDAKK